MATAEYEAWILAAAHSLRGKCNVRVAAARPSDPESVRGAKQYLEQHLLGPGHYYSERVDQPAMTAQIAFAEASACPSFQKLRRDLAAAFAL
jgi:hypothetical protein